MNWEAKVSDSGNLNKGSSDGTEETGEMCRRRKWQGLEANRKRRGTVKDVLSCKNIEGILVAQQKFKMVICH